MRNSPTEQLANAGPATASGLPYWKRFLDLSLLVLSLPGLLIIGGFVALVIKLGSPGPVLFRQKRVGHKGRDFVCFKFRTMAVNAEIESHRSYTRELIKSQAKMVKLDERKDPRLIPLGRILRASGLDELPQLFNVLRGDMSIVGPRPCIRYECEAYEPWHWQRFDAVPGLTGLWQVSGKNRTTFDRMVELDIEYSRKLSLWLDVKIILKTAPALWRQFCDSQAPRQQEPVREVGNALESFS
jgi:lipopolysaccharide/colanic/teichoic acid biosynthesis glycosyltransferase